MIVFKQWIVVFPLTLLILAGCGSNPKADYGRLQLVKAGGTVKLDGQPLSGAVISFDDLTDGSFSCGLTDSSGNYRLQLDSVKSGVKPGSKVVRISTSRKIIGLNSNVEEGAEEESPTPDRVPEKFNSKSTLIVEVTSDKTSYDFDLKTE